MAFPHGLAFGHSLLLDGRFVLDGDFHDRQHPREPSSSVSDAALRTARRGPESTARLLEDESFEDSTLTRSSPNHALAKYIAIT